MKAGWEVRPLGELCEILDSLRRPIAKSDRTPGPYPYYGATGIQDYVAGYLFDEELVLIGEDGAKWGAGDRTAFAISGKCWVNNHAHVIRPKRSLALDDWLIYVLNFSDLTDFISGVTVPKLNQGRMREIPVPLPSLEEQHRIVALLDDAFEGLSRARANAEANLKDARELFAATLREEFNSDSAAGNWQPLSSLGTVVTGSTPPTSDRQNYGTDIPFVKPGDFLPDGQLDIRADGLSKQGAMLARILPPGCALMVCIGATIGKAGFSDRAIATNQQINALIPKAGIDAEFLYLQMILPEFQRQVRQNAGQATLPIINKSKWSALRVWIPRDPADQFRITSKMREIRALLGTVELHYLRATEEGEQLRQVILQRAFTGELT